MKIVTGPTVFSLAMWYGWLSVNVALIFFVCYYSTETVSNAVINSGDVVLAYYFSVPPMMVQPGPSLHQVIC